MRRWVALLLVFVMILSLAACEKKAEIPKEAEASVSAPDTTEAVSSNAPSQNLPELLPGQEYASADGRIQCRVETAEADDLILTVNAKDLDEAAIPWVGIVPAGEYDSTWEADAATLLYEELKNGEQTVAFSFFTQEALQSGDFLLVFNDTADSTEDGEQGKILLSIPFSLPFPYIRHPEAALSEAEEYLANYGMTREQVIPDSASDIVLRSGQIHFNPNGADKQAWFAQVEEVIRSMSDDGTMDGDLTIMAHATVNGERHTYFFCPITADDWVISITKES